MQFPQNITDVGFTGTQVGMTLSQKVVVEWLLKQLHPTTIHHGDCIGADYEFHHLASPVVPFCTIHPPIKSNKRAFCMSTLLAESKDYLDRNRDIVDESQVLIATPKEAEMQIRSGTWYTIRYARKQRKHLYIVFPNGVVREEKLDVILWTTSSWGIRYTGNDGAFEAVRI